MVGLQIEKGVGTDAENPKRSTSTSVVFSSMTKQRFTTALVLYSSYRLLLGMPGVHLLETFWLFGELLLDGSCHLPFDGSRALRTDENEKEPLNQNNPDLFASFFASVKIGGIFTSNES